jgi:hypothetical protein
MPALRLKGNRGDVAGRQFRRDRKGHRSASGMALIRSRRTSWRRRSSSDAIPKSWGGSLTVNWSLASCGCDGRSKPYRRAWRRILCAAPSMRTSSLRLRAHHNVRRADYWAAQRSCSLQRPGRRLLGADSSVSLRLATSSSRQAHTLTPQPYRARFHAIATPDVPDYPTASHSVRTETFLQRRSPPVARQNRLAFLWFPQASCWPPRRR